MKAAGLEEGANTTPYWQLSARLPRFPPLTNDLEVDVVVVGAGLTGITAAHLLKEAGAKVALLERRTCARADTGHTTAHLTYVTDARLDHLVKVFGRDATRAFWEAGAAAMDEISDIVQKHEIDCEFKWVPGFLHSPLKDGDGKERELLQKDADLAFDFGFDALHRRSAIFGKTGNNLSKPGSIPSAEIPCSPFTSNSGRWEPRVRAN